MKNLKLSVIIRTYNEQKHIAEVLNSILMQDYKNYEVIIVDSESTDNTIKLLNNYNVQIVTIKKADFNFSYASNVGAEKARGDILVYLSGHSVIHRADYFCKLNRIFNDARIGGAYGDVIPFQEGGFVEKMYYWIGYLKNAIKPYRIEKKVHPGILSCSNAAISKEIWMQHPFTESLGKGGEDVEMAYYIIAHGKQVVFDRDLLVKHSHHLNYEKFKKQLDDWKRQNTEISDYLRETYGYTEYR